ncbi:MAG: M20/M25/M40 family metallo-hydrolase [candidate division Zixibacteria bacterium]|nr:M20/M25/M40 family metallo-hydrolase [candidate division Zixibacteria bacterium]
MSGKAIIFKSAGLIMLAVLILSGCGKKTGELTSQELSQISAQIDRAGLTPAVSASDLQQHVSYLAGDELGGRMTGSAGAKLAAGYLAENFRRAGLKPLPGMKDYYEQFQFTSSIKLAPKQNHLEISTGENQDKSDYQVDKDFRPLSFTANGEAEGEVVFAGYGLTVRSGGTEEYDSYAGLDVKDKIVLALRYTPEEAGVDRKRELNRYAGLRYKAMLAREQGAKALLIVTGPKSPNAGELAALSFDNSLAGSGIIAASITLEVAQKMFAAAGENLKEVQSQLDVENPHFKGSFPLSNVRVKISTGIEQVNQPDRNVLGLLESANPLTDSEYIIIGAHYDHLGKGEADGSLAGKDEAGQIHNGADDNASGTALVLELASYLSDRIANHGLKLKRNLVFALWSGEEIGLVGSGNFIKHPPVPLKKIAACLNFDMVGRLRDNKLVVQGVGSSNIWKELVEEENKKFGFKLVQQEDPYLPTDVTSFYPQEIPVLNFFTGSHEDYHRPTDDADKINYGGLEQITLYAGQILQQVEEDSRRPVYVKVENKSGNSGQRESLRAYLGTIPDYTAEDVSGVMLSGVRAGAPAEKAGLKGGDIIIEFAGQKIANIYDYTYALNTVKINVPVEIVVDRQGKLTKVTVIPEARN